MSGVRSTAVVAAWINWLCAGRRCSTLAPRLPPCWTVRVPEVGVEFDAALDFGRPVRDPANARQINPAYDVGDHLHMNPAGYRGIAASLFRTLEAHVCRC